jgi:competence protein ComFC
MLKFNTVVISILDFLLPQSEIDKKVSSITPEELAVKIAAKESGEDCAALSLFDYSDELIKRMIWSLKYRRNQRIAGVFGKILNDYLAEELSEREIFSNFSRPILIPIPLSKKRLRERGYNQAELIARGLVSASNGTLCALLTGAMKRIKDTPSQTALKDRRRRIENMKGVFSVSNSDGIRGGNIIVLDDVTTTGATLNEARRVLLEAGARQVLCVAMAH